MISRNELLRCRISKKNEVNSQIKTITSYLKRNKDTISRLSKVEDVNGFNLKKIQELKEKEVSYNIKIKELKNIYSSKESEGYDDEFKNEITKNKEKISENNELKKLQKEKIRKEKEERKKLSINYYNSERDNKRKERYLKREIDKGEKYFFDVCNTLPDYMRKKLDNLPGNKGYIWRGVHFYGKKPFIEDQPKIMYERIKGVNYVHRTFKGEYTKKEVKKFDDTSNNSDNKYKKFNSNRGKNYHSKKLISKTKPNDKKENKPNDKKENKPFRKNKKRYTNNKNRKKTKNNSLK